MKYIIHKSTYIPINFNNAFKPNFPIRNALFQYKHERHRLKQLICFRKIS